MPGTHLEADRHGDQQPAPRTDGADAPGRGTPMSTNLVLLAVLMFAVTYPSRALGLLAPAIDRLPKVVLDYLQLVGPAVLAALAAVSVMVTTEEGGSPRSTSASSGWRCSCASGLVAWRRNLFLGLVGAAVAIVASPGAGIGCGCRPDPRPRLSLGAPRPRSRPAGSDR